MAAVASVRAAAEHSEPMRDAAPSRAEVRRAAVGDSHRVHAVRQRAILGSAAGLYDADALEAWASGGSEDDLRHKIKTTEGFVAVIGGQVVGWANLDGAEVEQLYVDPDHGGVGVARRLYETIEDLATAHGARRLTTVASLRAVPVLRRFGFTEVRRDDRSYNGRTYGVADMVKRLELKPAGDEGASHKANPRGCFVRPTSAVT
jgi:putative acetyltransferase